MTNREFFEAIANSNVSAELVAFANESLVKLDAKNTKRRETPNKTQLANEPIKQAILDYLAGKTGVVSAEIATALDISTQKASALCKQLVESGAITSSEVKVKNKGAVKGYTLA